MQTHNSYLPIFTPAHHINVGQTVEKTFDHNEHLSFCKNGGAAQKASGSCMWNFSLQFIQPHFLGFVCVCCDPYSKYSVRGNATF